MKINLKYPDHQGYLVILQSVMASHLGNDILTSGQMSFLITSLWPMSPLGWGGGRGGQNRKNCRYRAVGYLSGT